MTRLCDRWDRSLAWLNRPSDRWIAGALGVGMLLVYLLTMAPDITWGWQHAGDDAGDLITAAWVAGVPHPPGYPTYTLLAWLFTRLPMGSVAWRVHLLSAVAGAATVGLAYLIGRDAFGAGADRPRFPRRLGAAVGGLLFGFAPLFWSHALIAEVYTLHLFFVSLVLVLMLRWRATGRGLPWAALTFGLGLGNHLTLAMMGPLILMVLWDGRRRLRLRAVVASAGALLLGLSVYVYLPWRAAADPIVNWGDPDTWEGFWWLVRAEAYEQYLFALPLAEIPVRLFEWWELFTVQFAPMSWPLALLGLWRLWRRDRWLGLGSVSHAAVNLVYSVGYNVSDAYVHLLPVFFYVAVWMGLGICQLFLILRGVAGLDRWRRPLLALLALASLALVAVAPLVDWHNLDLSQDREARDYGQEVLDVVEPDALILARADAHIFTLWYYRYVKGKRPDVVIVNPSLYTFQWYRETIASHHPELQTKGTEYIDLLEMVLRNVDQRPVYVTEESESEKLSDLELEAVGPLWQVIP